ncbi:Lipid II flippase FtsW [Corynebacterium choanae]|uniref:Lipid II flippase FtsW n=1 Tax=Corynebacterium choanae TaxID=1862358 RepID=A0A3G6J430_9CORY|nr:Lipid II flippase FtsW [Corynebacterium choanae]
MSLLECLRARRTEALLMLAGLVVVALAHAAVAGATTGATFAPETWIPIVIAAVVCVVIHVFIAVTAPTADQVIVPCVLLLNGLGIVMIGRLDYARQQAGSELSLAHNQVKLTIISLVVFGAVLLLVRDHRRLSRYSYLLGAAGLFLLVLPVIWPFGRPEAVEEAKIWISIGSLSVQPGEFAKILLILFFAKLLADKRQLFTIAGTKRFGIIFPRWRDIAQIVAVWFIAMGVMAAENDFGPVLLLFGTVLLMLYMATSRISWIMIGGLLIAIGAPILYLISAKIQTRVANTINPLADFDGAGFQPSQALFAWADGDSPAPV